MCVCVEIPAGETVDPIPACLLRKYISYARHYVHPSLSPEAAHTIQNFYLSLRSQAHTADATPITTRQLESLIRLTEVGFCMFVTFTSFFCYSLRLHPSYGVGTDFVCMSQYFCGVFMQARARLELRETATKSDAEDVVEIMKHRCVYEGCC